MKDICQSVYQDQVNIRWLVAVEAYGKTKVDGASRISSDTKFYV